MERLSTVSTNLAKPVLVLMLAVVVWRAATLPVTGAEALAWDRVVRPGAVSLLVTPGDWSGFLYGLIAKRAAGLFRLSEFSLRFPGIIGCLLFCCALTRICRNRLWLVLALALPAVLLNCFNLAAGVGLSLGLTALALAHPGSAGLSLGLAVAVCPQIGFVPLIAAAFLLVAHGFWRGMERVVIPAVAIGFVLLILPLSHGGPPLPKPKQPTERDAAVRTAIGILRAEAGKGTTRIGASPLAVPLLDFYRARYRRRNWLPGGPDADYFLWIQPDTAVGAASRRIVFQEDGVLLAR
jgi:hypothetical protein